jgi:hypothetical protein
MSRALASLRNVRGWGWERFEVSAWDCPRIPASFLPEERLALPPAVFAQEYECEFAESVDTVFTAEMLAPAFSDETVLPLYPEGE